ncbi:MAG: hypothetical protein EA357_10305 [Micavibrio sp.]|nr:MAG: hypothetical protein EA357_10305 [Micavibrio sp.]
MTNINPVQTAVVNTFQPGVGNNNERVGTPEQEPRTNQVQPRDAQSAEAQRSNEDNSLQRRDDENRQVNSREDAGIGEDVRTESRGSLFDVEV